MTIFNLTGQRFIMGQQYNRREKRKRARRRMKRRKKAQKLSSGPQGEGR